jgi:F-type H+-transporting ATPase subunit a
LLFIILSVIAAGAYAPILPHVQLPAEEITDTLFTLPFFGDFALTNTLVAIFLADILLLLLGFSIYRAIKRGDQVLTGISGAVEAILEALYNLTETTAGKWAKSIFPWMATIFMLVLVVNWMELIPGVDSIGLLHHDDHGYATEEIARIGDFPIITIVKDGVEEAGDHGHGHGEDLYGIVPFVRVTSTDLNFTIALALISVVTTQIYGVRALGASYFTKFFNVKSLFSKPFFGAIDFGVGLLEMVSEFSKILSFSFRLFGNIFAGSVLLFVIGSLVPVFAQTFFLILEFFVGMIQAIVFAMLTMVFMSQATVSHDHDEEGH